MACLVWRVADGDGFGLVWFGSVRRMDIIDGMG